MTDTTSSAPQQVDPRAVLAHADKLIDSDQLQAGYDRIAEQITEHMAELNPVIVCIMKGGMYAAVEITKRLSFPLELDYLHVTRYIGNVTRGGELVWQVSPDINLENRHVLLIDDILDEGKTLRAVLDAIQAQGAASIHTAMLLQKLHDRRLPGLQADFLGFEVEDRFVFGGGLDYKGHLRHLPAIYAVAADME